MTTSGNGIFDFFACRKCAGDTGGTVMNFGLMMRVKFLAPKGGVFGDISTMSRNI